MDPRAASRGGGGADRRPGGRRGGRGPGAAAEHRARRGVRRARVDGRPGGRCGGRRGPRDRPARRPSAAAPAAAADAADAAGAGRPHQPDDGGLQAVGALLFVSRADALLDGRARVAMEKVRNSRAQIVGARAGGADGGVDGRASRVSPAMAAFATAAIERAREQQREGGGSCSASLDAAGAACADPVNRASLARKMSAANGLLARRTSGATSSTEEVTTHAPPPLNEKRQSHFGASAKVAPAADADGPRRVSKGMRRLCSMRFPGARGARGRRRRPPPSRRRRHQSQGTAGGSRRARAHSRRAPSVRAVATAATATPCSGAARSRVR